MPEQYRRILWLIVLMVVIAAGALALVVARTKGKSDRAATTSGAHPPSSSGVMVQGQGSRRNNTHRNLSLQPEAFKMGRWLGQRFAPGKRERSLLVGTLTIGSERRIVQTTRTQTDDGEQVEIKIAGSPGLLTWDPNQGALSASSRANGSDRELIERLVLDSPDQFVLAQLRGASYYTVARNVRPMEADDNYTGALWDIVRVEDPDQDLERRPRSHWRLYYVNSRTGLIDKVVSEVHGEKIETEFQDWTEQAGKKWPSRIVWTRQGTRLMELSVQSFSSAASAGAQ